MQTVGLHQQKLQDKFKCKALGDVSFYLGLHIERDVEKRCMRVHQRKYLEALASNFGQSEGHVATPFPSGFKCVKGPEEESVGEEERRRFHSLVGSLMYAAVNTRPDVAFATGQLARVVQCPNEEQVAAGMRVAKYHGQKAMVGLQYSAAAQRRQKGADGVEPGRLFLTAFSDASFASEPEDMTSVGGFICCVGGGPTAWESKKQVDQALSSVESEYMALFRAALVEGSFETLRVWGHFGAIWREVGGLAGEREGGKKSVREEREARRRNWPILIWTLHQGSRSGRGKEWRTERGRRSWPRPEWEGVGGGSGKGGGERGRCSWPRPKCRHVCTPPPPWPPTHAPLQYSSCMHLFILPPNAKNCTAPSPCMHLCSALSSPPPPPTHACPRAPLACLSTHAPLECQYLRRRESSLKSALTPTFPCTHLCSALTPTFPCTHLCSALGGGGGGGGGAGGGGGGGGGGGSCQTYIYYSRSRL
ncbi:unnamed protein product [Closterium sp. NIES-53]